MIHNMDLQATFKKIRKYFSFQWSLNKQNSAALGFEMDRIVALPKEMFKPDPVNGTLSGNRVFAHVRLRMIE